MLRTALILIALLLTDAAHAVVLGIDGIISGNYEKTGSYSGENGIGLRSNTTLLFRGSTFRYGLMAQLEIPSSDTREYVLGGAVRWGSRWFLDVGAGYLKRDFGSYAETGWGLIAKPGYAVPLSGKSTLRISVPAVVKLVTSGVTTRTIVDYVPYLGFGYEF